MKKLVFLFLMLIGWMSGIGQNKAQYLSLGSRFECFHPLDLLGQSPLVYNGIVNLNDEAVTLCSKFNEHVNIVLRLHVDC